MIASLPMYDRAETSAANDRLWAEVSKLLPDAPKALTRDGDESAHWRDKGLFLSQTCGLPYRMKLHSSLAIVGAPVHRLDGCPPGTYRSALIAKRRDPRTTAADFDGAHFAYNAPDSQSGYAAILDYAAGAGLSFTPGPVTGAHRASARAVAEGTAPLAAIDAVSWRMIERWDDFANSIKIIGWTSPTPALPFVTAKGNDTNRLFDALEQAITSLSRADRDTLCLYGLQKADAENYLSMPIPAPPGQGSSPQS